MKNREDFAEMIVRNSGEKVPIGAILLADEIILPQDLDFALEHQKYSKKPLGEILVSMGAVNRDVLEETLKLQTGTTG